MSVQLLVEVVAVHFNRLHAESEFSNDVLAAVALGNELEDLAFTRREELVLRRGSLRSLFQDLRQLEALRDGVREVAPAAVDGLDRLDQFGDIRGLGEVPACPGAHSLAQLLLIDEAAQ